MYRRDHLPNACTQPGAGRGLLLLTHRGPLLPAQGGSGQRRARSGGYVAAVAPALRGARGAWIVCAAEAGAREAFELEGTTVVPVNDSSEDAGGIAGRSPAARCDALDWTADHGSHLEPRRQRRLWEALVGQNRRFARAAAAWAAREGSVWILDERLPLVPAMLRRLRPDVRIGYLLPVPFPAYGRLEELPVRRMLLRGLLGADVIGFRSSVEVDDFDIALRRQIGIACEGHVVAYRGRELRCGTFQTAVDFDRFSDAARGDGVLRRAANLRARLGPDRKLVLGVERSGDTRAAAARGEALRLLERTGALRRGEAATIGLAVSCCGRTGRRFGVSRSIRMRYEDLAFEELLSLYLAADVMVASPLPAGTDLVCQEFVATRIDEQGCLLLCDDSAAALGLERAATVRPYDPPALADSIGRALRNPPLQQQARMHALRQQLRSRAEHDWVGAFLHQLHRVQSPQPAAVASGPSPMAGASPAWA